MISCRNWPRSGDVVAFYDTYFLLLYLLIYSIIMRADMHIYSNHNNNNYDNTNAFSK